MQSTDEQTYAVIGSGLFGILAVSEMTRRGLTVHWYSADDEPGGVWLEMPRGKVRSSTEMVNPGWCVAPQFRRVGTVRASDFLREAQGWADARRGRQVRHFGEVVSAVEAHGDGVVVTTGAGCVEYSFVAVATGHYGAPRIPFEVEGDRVIHASRVADLSHVGPDERVLVVGGGQSGVEICEELLAERPGVHLTWSTGGKVRLISRFSLLGMTGTCLRYRTGEAAPRGFTIAKDPAGVRAQCVMVPARVLRVVGSAVQFSDATVAEFDHIIAATGYLPPVPIVEQEMRRGRSKGLRVSPSGRLVSLNHFGDGCGGASATCARREAREVGRLAVRHGR